MMQMSALLRSKILLLTVLQLYTINLSAKIYLVSVGISDYPGTKNDLRLPDNDAATIQWVYKENKHAETALLINKKATIANINSTMQRIFSKASENDIIVFFFSGHGVKGGFVCYDGLLSYQTIKQAMAVCSSKNKMIFADACYSGSIRENKNRKKTQTHNINKSNIMLFLSCRSNEKSIEQKGMTNGFFTYALQHGLRGGADTNRDRIITAKELFTYVSAKVKKMSGNRQHPVMWGKFSNTMPVMRW